MGAPLSFFFAMAICNPMESDNASGAQTERRGGAWPGGLPRGKDPTGRLSMSRHGFPAATAFLFPSDDRASAITESAEHVVVAGGGVVGEDGGHQVGTRDPAGREVEPAALAQAGASARARRAAVGPVERDETALEREAGRADQVGTAVEATATLAMTAVAPGAAGAADGPVQGNQRVGHGEHAAVLVLDTATQAIPARGASTADGLVAENRAVVDVRDRRHGHGRDESPEDVVGDRAAPAVLRNGAGAGGPTDSPVVRQCAMTDGEVRV